MRTFVFYNYCRTFVSFNCRKEVFILDPRVNKYLIDVVRDITVAKMSNTTISPNKKGGEDVADFMQEIYNKLVELNNKALD